MAENRRWWIPHTNFVAKSRAFHIQCLENRANFFWIRIQNLTKNIPNFQSLDEMSFENSSFEIAEVFCSCFLRKPQYLAFTAVEPVALVSHGFTGSCTRNWIDYLAPIMFGHSITGKSLSEALILAATNPQYVKILFIELQVQYMKTTYKLWTCCLHIFFVLTFRTIYVHNMFWAYSFHVLNW